MKFRIRRPSPALFVAILALIVAMGGSAVALQRGQNGDNLITKRTLSGNRLRLNTVTGKEVTNLVWHNLTLINGWQNYYSSGARPPAYAIDVQGFVHLRGAVSSGSSPAFAQLPKAVRPSANVYIVTDMFLAKLGRVEIQHGGTMYAEPTSETLSDATPFTDLEGITYWLGNR